MRKPPRKQGRRTGTQTNQSARQPPSTATLPPRFHPNLVAVIADHMASSAKAIASGTAEADAELLQQCAMVRQGGSVMDTDAWSRALLRVGTRSPATLAGLRAKLQIAIKLLPYPPSREDGSATRAALNASLGADTRGVALPPGALAGEDAVAAALESDSFSHMITWFVLYDVLDIVEQAIAAKPSGQTE